MKELNPQKTEYIEIQYTLSDFLLAAMFLRVFLFVRNFFNYSHFTDVYARRVCERYGFTANTRFGFKCYILRTPVKTLMFTMLGTILLMTYLLRIFENPYYSQ